MLKSLSPEPDEARDAQDEADNSESRMLRALKALSSHSPDGDDTRRAGQLWPADPAQVELRRDSGGARTGRDQRADGMRADGMRSDAMRPDGKRNDAHRPDFQRGDRPRNEPANGAFTRNRHRFVKDGEVQVVHMPAQRARDGVVAVPGRSDTDVARLQQLLDETRLKLDQAERSRIELQGQIKAVQTKSAHFEMALADAARLAESRQTEIGALQERLREAERALAVHSAAGHAPGGHGVGRGGLADGDLADGDEAASTMRVSRERRTLPRGLASGSDGASGEVAPRRPGRPRTRPIEPPAAVEPEPVQWWLTPAESGPKRGKRGASPR